MKRNHTNHVLLLLCTVRYGYSVHQFIARPDQTQMAQLFVPCPLCYIITMYCNWAMGVADAHSADQWLHRPAQCQAKTHPPRLLHTQRKHVHCTSTDSTTDTLKLCRGRVPGRLFHISCHSSSMSRRSKRCKSRSAVAERTKRAKSRHHVPQHLTIPKSTRVNTRHSLLLACKPLHCPNLKID